MTDEPAPLVLCFGEVLWDSLPSGRYPGGAPANVAFHLRRLGVDAQLVSAVGTDAPGRELLDRLKEAGIGTEFVAVRPGPPTGLVRVTIGDGGSPRYEILADAAWDRIELPPALCAAAPRVAAIVFGSLAQRDDNNRTQLSRLRSMCTRALQVFDVNLRPPFDATRLVMELAAGADLLKTNEEEAARLLGETADLETSARNLSARTGCPRVCITAGPRGAGLLLGDDWHFARARPLEVRDTVGAGDAFLAALVHGLIAPRGDPRATLERACRLAEFVASREGAMPAYVIAPEGGFR
jgi:fructokinase